MNENWMQYMQNPKAFTVKQWVSELLKEKYPKHESVLERISIGLTTKEDLESFGKLITELFEAGFLRAVNEYKGQLKEMGIQVKITGSETD